MECFSVFAGGCIKSSPGRQYANIAYLFLKDSPFVKLIIFLGVRLLILKYTGTLGAGGFGCCPTIKQWFYCCCLLFVGVLCLVLVLKYST